MAYTLDLSSALAKLERGKAHIDALRVEIEKVYADGSPITLRREYEPEQGRVVVRIDRVIDIPDHWGLIVGDAAHNLRCALDHLCWQLAVRHYNGVEPTDRNTLQMIHFPIVTDKKKWQGSVVHQWADPADADKLKDFQPFNLGPKSRARGYRHPFEGFCGFDGVDNVDKHRRIHLTYIAPSLKSFAPEDTRVFRDCRPATGFINVAFSGFPTNLGDELAHVEVIPTGPNPDVDFETDLAGYVAIGERWDVIKALDAFAEGVERILGLF